MHVIPTFTYKIKVSSMMKQSYHDTENLNLNLGGYFSGTINLIRLAVFLVHIRGRGASNIISYIKSTLLSKKDVSITTFMGLQRFNATKNKLVLRFVRGGLHI